MEARFEQSQMEGHENVVLKQDMTDLGKRTLHWRMLLETQCVKIVEARIY